MPNTFRPIGDVAQQLIAKFCPCAICNMRGVNLERYRGELWCNPCIEQTQRAERYSGRETGFGR